MRDYIRLGTARSSFITSLNFLTILGACSRQGSWGELVTRAKGTLQLDHAPLRAAVGCAHGQMESAREMALLVNRIRGIASPHGAATRVPNR